MDYLRNFYPDTIDKEKLKTSLSADVIMSFIDSLADDWDDENDNPASTSHWADITNAISRLHTKSGVSMDIFAEDQMSAFIIGYKKHIAQLRYTTKLHFYLILRYFNFNKYYPL